MANLCIIPARGGSKRIPRKNVRDFLGKPIIAYSIEAAIRSDLFDEVMVSTDDLEIAQIAQSYNAQVPFLRSEENANDYATTADVLVEVLNRYQDKGQTFDCVCCIYPTAPFITSQKLKEGYNLLTKNNFNSVFPIIQFAFPIQRAVRIINDHVSFIQPEFALTRSQDLERAFHDVGQFYWISSKWFLAHKQLISSNTGAIVISELEAQDIDNETDWKLAEIKFKLMELK